MSFLDKAVQVVLCGILISCETGSSPASNTTSGQTQVAFGTQVDIEKALITRRNKKTIDDTLYTQQGGGGVAYTPYHAVTVAHIVTDLVGGGTPEALDHDIIALNNEGQLIYKRLAYVVLHPDYLAQGMRPEHDIAVLVMSERPFYNDQQVQISGSGGPFDFIAPLDHALPLTPPTLQETTCDHTLLTGRFASGALDAQLSVHEDMFCVTPSDFGNSMRYNQTLLEYLRPRFPANAVVPATIERLDVPQLPTIVAAQSVHLSPERRVPSARGWGCPGFSGYPLRADQNGTVAGMLEATLNLKYEDEQGVMDLVACTPEDAAYTAHKVMPLAPHLDFLERVAARCSADMTEGECQAALAAPCDASQHESTTRWATVPTSGTAHSMRGVISSTDAAISGRHSVIIEDTHTANEISYPSGLKDVTPSKWVPDIYVTFGGPTRHIQSISLQYTCANGTSANWTCATTSNPNGLTISSETGCTIQPAPYAAQQIQLGGQVDCGGSLRPNDSGKLEVIVNTLPNTNACVEYEVVAHVF